MRWDDLPEIMAMALRQTHPDAIRLRVVVDQSARKVLKANSRPIRTEQMYEETSSGQRFFDEKNSIDGSIFLHKTAYCDGQKCAGVAYDAKEQTRPKTFGISNTFMDDAHWGFPSKPDPVRLYSVGMTPLPQALATAERMGVADVMGRRCDVFRFKDVGPAGRGQTLVYSLDRVTALPLRVASYSKPALLDADKPSWTWEATKLKEVAGRHIAAESTYHGFVVKEAEPGKWTSALDVTKSIHVAEIAFDEELPASHFWPTFPPGVMVLDQIAGKTYQVPSEGRDAIAPVEATAQVGTPIRADASSGGGPLMWAGIGLSLAVLAVAGVLWKRAR